ncbi:DDE-type integrase/transposase/recombinase [Cryobacterium sp. TMT4-31]|uniref:DDE-type integrase/transposase/recombinase n=1 Tax=Cryobacterium sp. TMT4-31 TaxID=1259259 RepID=UPI00141BE097
MYFATVIHANSRLVIGWAIADHMRTDLIQDALAMAVMLRRDCPATVIFHSDRGTNTGRNGSPILLRDVENRALLPACFA